MIDPPRKSVVIRYLGLFSVLYFVSLFLTGLAITYDIIESAWIGFSLLVSCMLTGMVFLIRRKRAFTRSEWLKLSIGAFAIVLLYEAKVLFSDEVMEKLDFDVIGALICLMIIKFVAISVLFHVFPSVILKEMKKAEDKRKAKEEKT